jgi:hypothetical protein
MSRQTIHLVQGDQNIDVDITLTDKANDNAPIDVSASTVRLFYRKLGADALTATVVCTQPNGGTDGLVRATLPAACMVDVDVYEGEFEIETGSKKQTVYDKLKFKVREQLEV